MNFCSSSVLPWNLPCSSAVRRSTSARSCERSRPGFSRATRSRRRLSSRPFSMAKLMSPISSFSILEIEARSWWARVRSSGSSFCTASAPSARVLSPCFSRTGVPIRGPYSRRSTKKASRGSSRDSISVSSSHRKSLPERSRLPRRIWMRNFVRWSGWPGLGMPSRPTTSPSSTVPSLSFTCSSGFGQKKLRPFVRITRMSPAIISMEMPRALPVSQIMGSPRRRDFLRSVIRWPDSAHVVAGERARRRC